MTENEGKTTVNGCDGWWNTEELKVDLTNCENSETSWFLNHCSIYDSITSQRISAGDVNFKTLRGQSLMYGDWLCQSGVDSWEFNYKTCKWEVTSGTKNLLAVKRTTHQVALN